MKKLIIIFSLLLLSGCQKTGWGKAVSFNTPDIKDDFCGVVINFQYCKCAFHNQYCDQIGMDKKAANEYVQSEYQKWLGQEVDKFAKNCEQAGGFFSDDKCQYCAEGYGVQDNDCVAAAEIVKKIEGPFKDDCTIKNDEFDKDWKKYSDIDEAINFEDRSYEAKQALVAYDSMIAKMTEAFTLDRDIEIEKQLQKELEDYRYALVNNIKTNLLKSFWRLSWTTYSTIKGAKGLGESFSEVLTSAEGVEAIGKGLKVVQGVIPNDSVLTINTDSFSGKAKSIGAASALEGLSSLGDPVNVATTFVESAVNVNLPSADITEEEINILKSQHLKKGLLDQALAASRQANEARQAKLNSLEQEIADLQKQISEWEAKEKDRVKFNLEDSCQKQKNKQ